MYEDMNIKFGAKMLFNEVKLKEGMTVEDVELAVGEMCNVVKENYGDKEGGFLGGQVYVDKGFVSKEGTFNNDGKEAVDERQRIIILTYWDSFDQHEESHRDDLFNGKLKEVLEYCDDSYEKGYEMVWQGMPVKK